MSNVRLSWYLTTKSTESVEYKGKYGKTVSNEKKLDNWNCMCEVLKL